jgi:hypothetical protein
MPWAAWPKDDGKGLARYVLPEVSDKVRTASNTADLEARGELDAVAREIYEALAAQDIRWARARYNPDDAVQNVRPPGDILTGAGDGTCLDLALLFAGVALGKQLLPLVIVLEGHALAAVSRTTERGDATGSERQRAEIDWTREGLLTNSDKLKQMVDEGRYVLVECTGFAVSDIALSATRPEGRGRINGRLDWGEAVRAGREQLEEVSRPLLFAVDVAALQDYSHFKPFDPLGQGIAALKPDLRSRFAEIFDDYHLVGGRERQLAALDTFVADPSRRYLLLTGQAGMGKTALLVEWIRRLGLRSDVQLVYHFISRQYGTAARQDVMASLVSQAAVAWRSPVDPGMVGASVIELEAAWLQLLQAAPPQEVIVAIDGVDEAEAAGWEVPRGLLPHTLPANVHIVVSARTMTGRDWSDRLGLHDAVTESVERFDEAGVGAVLAAASVPDWVRAPGPLVTLRDVTDGDPFYLRLLVEALTRGEVTSAADLARHPRQLDTYLQGWWDDLTAPASDPAVAALLGYMVVARGPLARDELVGIDPGDALSGFTVDAALTRVSRFLVGNPRTGVALAHWRLQAFSERALTPDGCQAYVRTLLAWCSRWRDHRSRYALVYGPGQYLEQEGPEDLAEVTALLTDMEFQKARIEEADDAAGLFTDLARLLEKLASVRPPSATRQPLSALTAVAFEAEDARARWLRPDRLVDLIAEGEAAEAFRRLRLLGPQPVGQWWDAAALILAWASTPTHPDAARELLSLTGEDAIWAGLQVLRDRVRARLDGSPEPVLQMWFPPHALPQVSDERMATAALDRLGGAPLHERGISGLPPPDPDPVFSRGAEAGTYLAEDDAPTLVAFARDAPGPGDALLTRYINLFAANPYALYRNRSLLSVLAAVVCLPLPHQSVSHALHLLESAFEPAGVRFSEFARLATLARCAASGDADAQVELESKRHTAMNQAGTLGAVRGQGDLWGHNTRRLAAHAEVQARVVGNQDEATTLLHQAANLPFGYAGYRAPASLALAEAVAVTPPRDSGLQQDVLSAALSSAHNIQEPAFCALVTARVTTLMNWWDSVPGDLPALVATFAADPTAAKFRPQHRLGEQFNQRSRSDHLDATYITHLTTSEEIAAALGLPPVAATQLNENVHPQSTVLLPDAAFAPFVASYLSARIVAADLPPAEQAQLIAILMPSAATDATELDRVLGRLITLLPNLTTDDLEDLTTSLASRMTLEPAGQWAEWRAEM